MRKAYIQFNCKPLKNVAKDLKLRKICKHFPFIQIDAAGNIVITTIEFSHEKENVYFNLNEESVFLITSTGSSTTFSSLIPVPNALWDNFLNARTLLQNCIIMEKIVQMIKKHFSYL